MEMSLKTDGTVAALRVSGPVRLDEVANLSEYLRVARENGAVRCIVDFSECGDLPTPVMAVLFRESTRFQEAGGGLAVSGVTRQNPFLAEAVATCRLQHYRTVEEAWAAERGRDVAAGATLTPS